MQNEHRTDALKYALFAVVTGFFILHSGDAFAQTSTALFDSGTNVLTALSNLLTTTWARLIGIVAVFGLGVACAAGKLHLSVAATVIVGIILMFSAPAIVNGLQSSAG